MGFRVWGPGCSSVLEGSWVSVITSNGAYDPTYKSGDLHKSSWGLSKMVKDAAIGTY